MKHPKSSIKHKLVIIPSLLLFAAIAVFGLSIFTGVSQQSNVGNSKASAQEPADINNDNKVDIFDLSILLSNWNKTGTSTSDVNSDNVVNIFDLSTLLSRWGAVVTVTPTPTATPTPVAGGCPAYPAFPDANCTGWQHTGVTLKTVPAQQNSGTGWNWEGAPFNYVKVTQSGAILDGLDINGNIYIDYNVSNVTIKRSRIKASGDYIIRMDLSSAHPGLVITDVEIDGLGAGAVGVKGSDFSITRLNAHNFSGKAVMLGSNTLLEDSYIHGNVCYPPDHQSGIGTNGGASNIIMRHNNVDLTPSECTSGGISNYDDFGAFHNVLIEKNLINSGGYCLKSGFEDNNAAGNSGMQVLNNVFGRKYYPECGSFGVVSNWMPSVSGNVWSGNTWGSGAAANAAHAVGDTVNP